MYILYNRLITALNEKKPDSTEFYIAKMMIWNLWELPRMSISDVAKMCAVSKSTISKFVRDIGFEDYLDFKLEAVRQGYIVNLLFHMYFYFNRIFFCLK